jgi:hypothetical protein
MRCIGICVEHVDNNIEGIYNRGEISLKVDQHDCCLSPKYQKYSRN